MLTGITMTLFSRKILSASGVVGPLAPSAMIWDTHTHTHTLVWACVPVEVCTWCVTAGVCVLSPWP